MAETNNEKWTSGKHDATGGLEISPAQAIEDDAYEEKVKGADGVFAYANVEATPLDEATNARLLRKIDVHVLPWLCGLYMLQYMDKGVQVYLSPHLILSLMNPIQTLVLIRNGHPN
jgi:hypothetical protein